MVWTLFFFDAVRNAAAGSMGELVSKKFPGGKFPRWTIGCVLSCVEKRSVKIRFEIQCVYIFYRKKHKYDNIRAMISDSAGFA